MAKYMTTGLGWALVQAFEDGLLCTIDGEKIKHVFMCKHWVEIVSSSGELIALNYEEDYCTGIQVNSAELGTLDEIWLD